VNLFPVRKYTGLGKLLNFFEIGTIPTFNAQALVQIVFQA